MVGLRDITVRKAILASKSTKEEKMEPVKINEVHAFELAAQDLACVKKREDLAYYAALERADWNTLVTEKVEDCLLAKFSHVFSNKLERKRKRVFLDPEKRWDAMFHLR